ncbi:hypothetical protein ABZP36_033957 [Zizania latifolia]
MSTSAAVHASRVLRCRAAGEDLGAHHGGDDDGGAAFWSGEPRLYDFSLQQRTQTQTPPSPVASPPSATAESGEPCLLTLQCSGVGWGVRKRVRYVGRNRAGHVLSGSPAGVRSAARWDEKSSTKAYNEKSSPEEQEAAEESSEDDHKVAMPEKKKRKSGCARRRASSKRPRTTLPAPKAEQREEDEEEEEEEEEKAAAPSGMVDRWKAGRYATAKASLFGIMRAHGACVGKPIPRGVLRKEARAHIGDTGLLDHLLRHIAGNLAPGRAERFRRRHNADGILEYWLEPAELVALRREAGVTDPYWVPPPGWKPGDPVSPEAYALELKRQVEQLATELTSAKRSFPPFSCSFCFFHWSSYECIADYTVPCLDSLLACSKPVSSNASFVLKLTCVAMNSTRRHMEHLTSNVIRVTKEMKSEEERSYNSWQGKYACMVKANDNLEKQILSWEEKYENARQVNGELKEELLFLKEKYVNVVENNTRLEQQMATLSTSFLSLKEELLWLKNSAEQHMVEQEQADMYIKDPWKDDKQESHAGKATDDAACSVRICKPQGTFQWPTMAFSPELGPPSPLIPTADALANFATMDELCEYMLAGGLPTPTSASSTNAGKLPLLPAPASPIQPLPQPSTTSAHDLRHRQPPSPHCRTPRHLVAPACWR